ncbi:MAG: hypothetical protein AB2669_07190 [Candidatus Thiodiazotropha endolucinida]|nr:hypothetical protein [Candidatus Thiodiazotropha taylori]MCW4250345.1 hypothetical protein [Candidatus Thiodiazotropha endolucinida]MCG7952972.1 hypothetical protein [Candidatus Thiodiazotropha taylori]MCG8061013.1 hypothetical protein [Candidatus Thiodiazotropha taylori]MCG8100829.1 hypothetical protein [Candidatus Thiodiazotropha taylori]
MMDYCVAKDPEYAEELLMSGNLSHAEIADTLRFLREEGYKPAKLQKITGYRDYTIRHYLRISKKLVPPVKELLHKNRLKFSMARAIASLPPESQEDEARKALMTATSVHRLRSKLSGDDKFCDEETARYFERLSMKIAEQTGLVVEIKPDKDSKHSGTMSFRYTDLRDFDSICSWMRVDLSEL